MTTFAAQPVSDLQADLPAELAADRPAAGARTRLLLAAGVAAGPLYMTVGLTLALTRDGFDLGRHALSLLALGHLGWIQVVNFLVTGVLCIAAAAGARRVLGRGPGGTWGPRLMGVFGAGVVAAGLLRADPADGFPAGTPAGIGPVSWHGAGHMAGFGIGFLCLIAACFVVARGLRAGTARLSRAAGAVVLAATLGSFAAAGTTVALVALYVSVVTAWIWLAGVSIALRRA